MFNSSRKVAAFSEVKKVIFEVEAKLKKVKASIQRQVQLQ